MQWPSHFWGATVIIISGLFGLVISRLYRKHAVQALLKSPGGRKLYSVFPIVFAVILMLFYFDAGLYLIMENESTGWDLFVGFATLVGGSYYSWWVYVWCLPQAGVVAGMLQASGGGKEGGTTDVPDDDNDDDDDEDVFGHNPVARQGVEI